MVTREELFVWLRTLSPKTYVGIDEGGLCLVTDEAKTGPYLEVGGMPLDDDAEYEITSAPAREVHDYGWNEEHLEHYRGDWVDEVANGDTYLGYNDWVANRVQYHLDSLKA